MEQTLKTILLKSPLYSIRAFFCLKYFLAGLGILLFGFHYRPDTFLLGSINPIFIATFFFTLSTLGVIGMIWRRYLIMLSFAIIGVFFFTLVGYHTLTIQDNNAGMFYLADAVANMWLFIKIRFNRFNLNILN